VNCNGEQKIIKKVLYLLLIAITMLLNKIKQVKV